MNKFTQHDLTADIVKTNNPRIGVIALSTDFTIEQDYRNICNSITVDIFAHGGSLFAVIIYFRVELADALKYYKLSSGDSFLNKLLLGSLPILITGFLLRDFISENLRTLDIIALSTIFFGILLWAADRA